MTREEELKLLNEAAKAGKIKKIPTTNNKPIKYATTNDDRARNNVNSKLAKRNTNAKDRERKYRQLGLDLKSN